VKEQSHKDEMSAAIRGDFQRLRERGVSATLAPQETATVAPPPPPVQEADVRAAPDAPMSNTASVEAAAEDVAETSVSAAEVMPAAEEVEEAEDEQTPAAARPGWLSRFVGR
jgi:hypothetical protein